MAIGHDPGQANGGKSLTAIAYERVREDIITCRLRPGEKLPINTMAEQYQVGASAVREALSRLVTEGLVDALDQRGFCVAGVSREDLLDLTRTRVAVERMAVTSAIENGSVEWEAELIATYHKLSRKVPESLEQANAPEWHDWRQLHRQFHEVLVEGCGSNWLRFICKLLYDRSERYRNLAVPRAARAIRRDVMAEHKAIVDAVLQRDAPLACRLLGEHLEETSRQVLRAAEGGIDVFGTAAKHHGTEESPNPASRGGKPQPAPVRAPVRAKRTARG